MSAEIDVAAQRLPDDFGSIVGMRWFRPNETLDEVSGITGKKKRKKRKKSNTIDADSKFNDASALRDEDDGVLVVTTESLVAKYAINEGTQSFDRCIASWSFASRSARGSLSTDAVICSGRCFVGRNKELLYWREDAAGLDRLQRQKFGSNVQCLKTHPLLKDAIVVVLIDGTILLYSTKPEKIESVASFRPARKGACESVVSVQIISSGANKSASSSYFFLLVGIATDEDKSSSSSSGKIRALRIRPASANVDAHLDVGAECVVAAPDKKSDDDSGPLTMMRCVWHREWSTLSVQWGSNTWQALKFPVNGSLSSTWHKTWCGANGGRSLFVREFSGRIVSLDSMGANGCLAIVALDINSNDDDDGDRSFSLSIWDAFRGVVASTNVDAIASSGSVSCVAPSAWGGVERIAYAVDNHVLVRGVKCAVASLASLLGKMQQSGRILRMTEADGTDADIDDEERSLQVAASKGAHHFDTAFARQFEITGAMASQRFVDASMRLALANEDTPIWGPVESLLSAKLVSTSAYPELLERAMKHEQLRILEMIVQNDTDVSETDLVRILCFVLRRASVSSLCAYDAAVKALSAPKTSPVKEIKPKRQTRTRRSSENNAKKTTAKVASRTSKRKRNGSVAGTENNALAATPKKSSKRGRRTTDASNSKAAFRTVSRFSKLVLSSTYDSEFMCSALRRLTLSEVGLLLSMALHWMAKDSGGGATLNENVCCRIVEILIDAHFMQLRLSMRDHPSIAAVLSQLHGAVGTKIEALKNLTPLSGHIAQLNRGSPGPRSKPLYSIEILSI